MHSAGCDELFTFEDINIESDVELPAGNGQAVYIDENGNPVQPNYEHQIGRNGLLSNPSVDPPSSHGAAHLSEFASRLDEDAQLVKRLLEKEGTDEQREGWFMAEMRRQVRQHLNEADAASYEIMGRFDLSWRGLARYWRKKAST